MATIDQINIDGIDYDINAKDALHAQASDFSDQADYALKLTYENKFITKLNSTVEAKFDGSQQTNNVELGVTGILPIANGGTGTNSVAGIKTTIGDATTSTSGLMSKDDKTKLNGIAANANNYSHPTSAGNKHIPSGGSSGQILRWSASGTAVWGDDNNTIYNNATQQAAGLMSAADKIKLDGLNKDNYLAKTGGTITGDVAMSGKSFRNVNDIEFTDGKWLKSNYLPDNYLAKTGGTVTGQLNYTQQVGVGSNSYQLCPIVVTSNAGDYRAGYGFHNINANASFLYLNTNGRYRSISNSGKDTQFAFLEDFSEGNLSGMNFKAQSDSTPSSIYQYRSGQFVVDAGGSCAILLGSMGNNENTLMPYNSYMNLGTSTNKWNQIYANNSTISTSDRNLKREITSLTDKHLKFFSLLQPVSFQFIDGKSGRTHIGFISQDIENALEKCGLTSLDFAGFCKDQKTTIVTKTKEEKKINDLTGEEEVITVEYEENVPVEGEYIYSLRYEEFIALNTQAIQYTLKKLESAEEKLVNIEKRLAVLEAK